MVGLDSHLLTGVVFLPLAWAMVGLLIPASHKTGQSLLRGWTLLGSLATFALSVMIYLQFSANGPDFQLMERAEWLPGLGISYAVGVDGISLWLILLTTFLMPLAVLGSFHAVEK